MRELTERLNELYRRLMRHRERYVKAWIAATGVRPEDSEIVEFHRSTPNGLEVVVQVRKRTQ